MNEKKKVSLKVVILYCLCAVIWDVNLIVHLVDGSDSYTLMMYVICAIAWSLCGIIWIVRFIKSKKESEE